MCGLFGAIGAISQSTENAISNLAVIDSIRGMDSTGIASIPRNNKPNQARLVKKVMTGAEFVEYHDISKIIGNTAMAVLGHNRAATGGYAVTPENAHPFQVRNNKKGAYCRHLIGTHNGTIAYESVSQLQKKYGEFGTDSELLYTAIAQEGPEVLRQIRGSWSLVWWDFDRKSLFMIRNDDRPMTFAYSEDHKVLIWASEADMLRLAMRRHKNVGMDGSTWFTMADQLYQIKAPEKFSEKISNPQPLGEIKGKPVVVYQTPRVYGRQQQQQVIFDKEEEKEEKKSAAQTALSAKSSQSRNSQPTSTPRSTSSIKQDLKDHLRGVDFNVFNAHNTTCCCCDNTIEKGEGALVHSFWGSNQFVCQDCTEAADVQELLSVAV